MSVTSPDQWHGPVTSTEPTVPGARLDQTVRGALGWSFLNNFVGRVGASLVGIVLARILVPEDYGVYAVALVALNALLSMNELGVSLAVVRWPGDVRPIVPTVATLAMASSSILYVACFLLAPMVARGLGAPDAAGVLRLLSFGVVIDGITAVPAGLMTREFMQRRRLVIDTAAFAVVSTLSISLAILGAGAWSLAVGSLAGNLVTAALILWWTPHRFRPGFDRHCARELLAFGLPLAGASLLVFAMLNVDYTVVGRTLGPEALGIYLVAFNLSSWPVNVFSSPVRRVALPGFAVIVAQRQSADRAVTRAWVLLLAATLPAALLLAVFAQPLIGFLYGDKWLAAAGPLRFLAVLAVVRVLGELIYDFLVAQGRSRAALSLQAIWLAALVPALVTGAHLGGVTGVAVGHAAVAVLVVIPALILTAHRGGVRARGLVVGAIRPLFVCVLAAACAVAVLEWVDGRLAQLVIGGCLVLAVYGAGVYPMRKLVTTFSSEAPTPSNGQPEIPSAPEAGSETHAHERPIPEVPVQAIPFVDLAAQHDEVADEVREGFAEVLATTSFIQGKPVAAFEEEFAAYLGVEYCIGVGNGTDALELALRAGGIGPGDEVILPANTFVATAEAVVRAGGVPVLVDVHADTLLMDPARVAEAITPRTRALMPVHLYGQAAQMELLAPIAERHGLVVVEDAAQSQGARRHGRATGTFGIAAGTSFYPGKNLGAYGDAGAVLTSAPHVARTARLLGNHGSERRYEHELLGLNSRLDTLQAVVLRAKLSRLDGWNAARRRAADRYTELLGGLEGLQLPVTAEGNEHVWHLYVVQVEDRDHVLSCLSSSGVGAGIHYPVPIHLHPAFAFLGQGPGSFPVSETAAGRILSLPMHPHLTLDQQKVVAEAVRAALI